MLRAGRQRAADLPPITGQTQHPRWVGRTALTAAAVVIALTGCGGSAAGGAGAGASSSPTKPASASKTVTRVKLTGRRIVLQACVGNDADGCDEPFSIGLPVGWREASYVTKMRRDFAAAYGERAGELNLTALVPSHAVAPQVSPKAGISVYTGGRIPDPSQSSCEAIAVEMKKATPNVRLDANAAATAVGGEPACVFAGDAVTGNVILDATAKPESRRPPPSVSRLLVVVHDQRLYALSASNPGDTLNAAAVAALDAVNRSWRWSR